VVGKPGYVETYDDFLQKLKTEMPLAQKIQMVDNLISKFEMDYSVPDAIRAMYIRRLKKHRDRIHYQMRSNGL
jgi:hypothetical protein